MNIEKKINELKETYKDDLDALDLIISYEKDLSYYLRGKSGQTAEQALRTLERTLTAYY